MDRLTSAPLMKPRALSNNAAVQAPGCRRVHNSEPWAARGDQADVDSVVVASANELFGAVERIDKKEHIIVRGNTSSGHFLFGDHRNTRRCARECSEYDQLGGTIGFG